MTRGMGWMFPLTSSTLLPWDTCWRRGKSPLILPTARAFTYPPLLTATKAKCWVNWHKGSLSRTFSLQFGRRIQTWNFFRPGPRTWLTMASIWMSWNGRRGHCWSMRAMSGPAFPMHRRAAPCFRQDAFSFSASATGPCYAMGHHCGSKARRSAMNVSSGCSSSLSSHTSKVPTMP